MQIGIISDTHGLLRPEAVKALQGCEAIIHAGDIGKQQVLTQLDDIAPVIAVRGNIDKGSWVDELPDKRIVELAGKRIYLLHNLKEIVIDPVSEDIDIVIAGHSHKPVLEQRESVLYINPGSAGPRRFRLPVAVALLTINNGKASGAIIELPV